MFYLVLLKLKIAFSNGSFIGFIWEKGIGIDEYSKFELYIQ